MKQRNMMDISTGSDLSQGSFDIEREMERQQNLEIKANSQERAWLAGIQQSFGAMAPAPIEFIPPQAPIVALVDVVPAPVKQEAPQEPIEAPPQHEADKPLSSSTPTPKIKQQRGMVITMECSESAAYRSLTKASSDLLLFVLSRRQYPAENRDYDHPLNEDKIKIVYSVISESFTKVGLKAPNKDTIRLGIIDLMAKGFIDLVKQGGSKPGDVSVYRLTENWKSWKVGTEVFSKPLVKRGFCK